MQRILIAGLDDSPASLVATAYISCFSEQRLQLFVANPKVVTARPSLQDVVTGDQIDMATAQGMAFSDLSRHPFDVLISIGEGNQQSIPGNIRYIDYEHLDFQWLNEADEASNCEAIKRLVLRLVGRRDWLPTSLSASL